MSKTSLPRNTTHQAELMLYGDIARTLHRVSGIVIVLFTLIHVLVQTIWHVPVFATTKAAAPWLQTLQEQNWIHAILFFCIAFHTFYGLKLLIGEIGVQVSYKAAFWAILIVSLLFGLREVLRYAGI
jgi:succinate dehydrogenase/fumarate reductase cytochrome b subunit